MTSVTWPTCATTARTATPPACTRPPHEFALNPPKAFAGLREDTYRRYAWPRERPRWLGGWRGVTAALAAAAALLVVLSEAATGRLLSTSAGSPPGPYQIVPYALLLVLVGAPALWCAAVLGAGAVRYWHDIHGPVADLARPRSWAAALVQAVQLRHMRGGEAGCDYPGDAPSPARRRFHQTLVYGFGLCLVSTVLVAVEQDLLGTGPPYAYLSVPVAAGTIGGIGMIAGGAGLLALRARSDPARGTQGMRGADYAFTAALLILAASGLLTLAVRDTATFGPVLAAHLAAVMTAFAIAPYTKFAHWVYRLLAIYKHNLDALSRRRPSRARHHPSANRAHRYRLMAELAQRVAILGGLRLVDRRAAVRAVRRHRPRRAGSGARRAVDCPSAAARAGCNRAARVSAAPARR